MNDEKAIERAPGIGAHRSRGAASAARDHVSPAEQRLAALARALGHPARVAIVRMLIHTGECVCGDIVSRLPLAQATVSQHLKVLKEAGLVRGTITPPRVCYCIDPEVVQEFQTLIAALTSEAPDVSRID